MTMSVGTSSSSTGTEKKIDDNEPSIHCHRLQIMHKTQEDNDRPKFVIIFYKRRRGGASSPSLCSATNEKGRR
jgi:hypothetical protein